MRNAMLLVMICGFLGSSCGGDSGPDSGPCADFSERLCAKAVECQDSSGEFDVAVGTSGVGTYTSCSESQCVDFVLFSEKNCNDASESEQQACEGQIEAAQCGSGDNRIFVNESCDF